VSAFTDTIHIDPGRQEPLASFNSLDNTIQRFIESIPPIERQSVIPLDYQMCMCSLAHASDIQLHRPFAVENNISRARVLKAADAIVELNDLWASELDFIESMLAVSTNCLKQIEFADPCPSGNLGHNLPSFH
jgi:hypothetical protein